HAQGYQTSLVRNTTDVDDDIVRRSARQGLHYRDVAVECELRFRRSLARLGLLPATHEPRVTGHIPEIIRCVEGLVERGHGYVVHGAVFFDVTTAPAYGRVPHLDAATMTAVSAERGANPGDPRKRNPLDFVLWQPKDGPADPAWPSPWGMGRPGWH